jgi:glyoxylase-like metal-dependent hydrolase (beta-lactamase superfamily II)
LEVTMPYSGDVSPGSEPAVRELADLVITKVSVGPMDNNAYLLRCLSSGDQVLIDAANEADRLLELIGDTGLSTVVTTHRHGDHWQALRAVVADTGAQTLAGAADADELPVEVDRRLEDGETIELGASTLEIIGLRGHTPGSIAVLYHDPQSTPHLFTGDSLFPGGVGKTHSPEDFTSLIDDVEARIFDVLPDDTWFYPGHGDDSTLGAERPKLGEWRARGW